MRKLTIRDLMTTLIVAAVVVPFIGYSVRGSFPLLHETWGWRASARGVPADLAFGRECLSRGGRRAW